MGKGFEWSERGRGLNGLNGEEVRSGKCAAEHVQWKECRGESVQESMRSGKSAGVHAREGRGPARWGKFECLGQREVAAPTNSNLPTDPGQTTMGTQAGEGRDARWTAPRKTGYYTPGQTGAPLGFCSKHRISSSNCSPHQDNHLNRLT